MGKQSTIRNIRKRIKKEGGFTAKLIKEISIKGYALRLNPVKGAKVVRV